MCYVHATTRSSRCYDTQAKIWKGDSQHGCTSNQFTFWQKKSIPTLPNMASQNLMFCWLTQFWEPMYSHVFCDLHSSNMHHLHLVVTLQNSYKPKNITYTIIQYPIWPFLPHGDGYLIFFLMWNMPRNLWTIYCMRLVHFTNLIDFGLIYLINFKQSPTEAAKVRLQVSLASLFHKSRYVCTVHWLFSVHKISESKTWSWSRWLQDQKCFP